MSPVDGEKVPDWIRPLALCVFRRDDGTILAAAGYDSVKDQRFYRPLGGGIDFGERAEDAARREIREELGAEVHGLQLLGTFENIFVLEGETGHELIWLYEAQFEDTTLYENDVVMADEGGSAFEAHWVNTDQLATEKIPLFPDGLAEMLSSEPTGV